MLSIIVCSKQNPSWDIHQRNVAATVGAKYEYIRIDNTKNEYGICSAYNKGVELASGDILVFVHEDVFFMEPKWGEVLIRKFAANPTIGMIGVAGTQYLMEKNPAWIAAGRPFLRGRVVHELNGGKEYILTVFSWDKDDAEVVAIDGLFMAIRKTLFEKIRFDEKTFPSFHFYDIDISMQVLATHKIIVTWDILLKHLSGGKAEQSWIEAAKAFLKKYESVLPVSCVNAVPNSSGSRPGPLNYNLKEKAPQVTII